MAGILARLGITAARTALPKVLSTLAKRGITSGAVRKAATTVASRQTGAPAAAAKVLERVVARTPAVRGALAQTAKAASKRYTALPKIAKLPAEFTGIPGLARAGTTIARGAATGSKRTLAKGLATGGIAGLGLKFTYDIGSGLLKPADEADIIQGDDAENTDETAIDPNTGFRTFPHNQNQVAVEEPTLFDQLASYGTPLAALGLGAGVLGLGTYGAYTLAKSTAKRKVKKAATKRRKSTTKKRTKKAATSRRKGTRKTTRAKNKYTPAQLMKQAGKKWRGMSKASKRKYENKFSSFAGAYIEKGYKARMRR